MLDNTPDQPSNFRTKNWVEINDESKESYRTGSDIKFKTTMLTPSLCVYADAYILVKETIAITETGDNNAAERLDERNKGVTFKICTPFTKCISRINGTQMHNAQDTDIVMPMYNFIEYSDSYSEASGNLWKYYKYDPNDDITLTESFKNKIEINGKTLATGNKKNVVRAVPLKYLSNFWRSLEMPLINCEVDLILTWCKDCVISSATGETKFTDTKLYILLIILSTQVLKARLTEKNINQIRKHMHKGDI